jgi:hypothetical protein
MDYQRQTTAEIKDCHLAGLLGEQPRFWLSRTEPAYINLLFC